MQSGTGAVVVPLYGERPEGLDQVLSAFCQAGLLVVAVNNGTRGLPSVADEHLCWLDHGNRGGLAGGLNRGVNEAVALGYQQITLLDQDSRLGAEEVLLLQQAARSNSALVVGPRVWDVGRAHFHTRSSRPRLLITSGSTFHADTWKRVGPFHEWMEIDFIDHEWCSRARHKGIRLEVLEEVRLDQQFGQRHPSALAHHLGLQLYSPYRRAVALRNLRWLIHQGYVPLDIRMKETMKMVLKPLCWLALEPGRRRTIRYLHAGLAAPLEQPFPQEFLEHMQR